MLEMLLKKADVDRVFSFNKAQWTQAAPQMIAPGWNVSVYEHESGVQIIGYDPSTALAFLSCLCSVTKRASQTWWLWETTC
jgi:hypothetical protein